MDVESLEKENDRGLDSLAERVGLLKAVRVLRSEQGQSMQGCMTAWPRHLLYIFSAKALIQPCSHLPIPYAGHSEHQGGS